MPEVCEIVMTSHYLTKKLKGRYITNAKVISGRYLHKKIQGFEMINDNVPLKIKSINTKGKFLWFELYNENKKNTIYLMNTFGMTGSWNFTKDPNNRVQFTVQNKDKTKEYQLFYTDARNFGTIKITDNYDELSKKLNKLGRDLLKTEFTDDEFVSWVRNYKDKNKEIVKVLMTQENNKGLGSGLGNYLAPEILYRAKISPFRKIGSLSKEELYELSKSIKYILKLCYTNNKIGYMEQFKNFIDKHRLAISKNEFPEYHKDTFIDDNIEFAFSVYQKSTDPLGNPVKTDTIIKDRTTHWVPNIQK